MREEIQSGRKEHGPISCPTTLSGHAGAPDRFVRIHKVANVGLVLCFAVLIELPILDMIFGLDQTSIKTENRSLAPIPDAIAALISRDQTGVDRFNQFKKSLSLLPRQARLYAYDHFGFRSFLIRQNVFFKWGLLRVSPNPKVLLGGWDRSRSRDPSGRWLFYNDEGILGHYRAGFLFSHAELEQWRLALEQRRDWLSHRGIRYLFVIASEKSTIYPEYLPRDVQRLGEITRTDQLVNYLREKSSVQVVDTRASLRSARERYPENRLFYRNDTHWNEVGAFYAYESILGVASPWYAELQPLKWSDFDLVYQDLVGGDLARMFGLPDQFHEVNVHLDLKSRPLEVVERDYATGRERIRSGANNGLKLLMFRDSFGVNLMPLLSQHFESALFIGGKQFDVSAVEDQKPDLVITEIVERYLMPDPPELMKDLEEAQPSEGK